MSTVSLNSIARCGLVQEKQIREYRVCRVEGEAQTDELEAAGEH